MKFRIVIIVLLVGLNVGCRNSYNEPVISYYDNGFIKERIIYPNINDTTQKKLYEYYPEGPLHRYSELTDNAWDGNVKSFYLNGNIKEDLHFQRGIEHGVFRLYDTTGTKIQEYLFDKGKKLVYSELLTNDSLSRYKYVYHDVINDTAYYSGQVVYEKNDSIRPTTTDYYITTKIDTVQLGEECEIFVKSNVGCDDCYIEIELEKDIEDAPSRRIFRSDKGDNDLVFAFKPTIVGYDFIMGKLYVKEPSIMDNEQILHIRDFTFYVDFVVVK